MGEKNCMEEKLSEEMKKLLQKYSQEKSNLIQILNEVRSEEHTSELQSPS